MILQENHVHTFTLQKTVTLEIHNANKSIGRGDMKKIHKHIELRQKKGEHKIKLEMQLIGQARLPWKLSFSSVCFDFTLASENLLL